MTRRTESEFARTHSLLHPELGVVYNGSDQGMMPGDHRPGEMLD
jgi:hypothetical protein